VTEGKIPSVGVSVFHQLRLRDHQSYERRRNSSDRGFLHFMDSHWAKE
jgi:hypothetical protein